MNRNYELTKYISKSLVGIECGPWKSPLCPKFEGFNCYVLDYFDYEELIQRAKNFDLSESEASKIEKVDFIGSAQDIYELTSSILGDNKIDYIISSHNFEHIPNPIKFMLGCGKLLNCSGVVSMAIPIKNYCFDCFRELSRTSELLVAYFENRIIPSNDQIFDHLSSYSEFNDESIKRPWFTRFDSVKNLEVNTDLKYSYELYLDRILLKKTEYMDVHCWTFTPASFKLIFESLWFLGVIPMKIKEISDDIGCEFIVHFYNAGFNHSGINLEDYKYLHLLKIKSQLFTSDANKYE
jgi:hypothetical protein